MLYKKKYLICLIDIATDNIVSVYDNAIQFSEAYKVDGKSILSKAFNGDYVFRKRYKVEFIDCYEKHNDIFAEEDKEFIKFIEKEKPPKVENLCKFINVSERTFYRKSNKFSNFKEKVLKQYMENINSGVEK